SFADSSRVHRIALPDNHSPFRNSSGEMAIRLCTGLNLEDRSMISAILFPNARKISRDTPVIEGPDPCNLRTSASQGTCRRGPGGALIYKNVPVEIHVFDHRTGASGYGGKRVLGDVDFEHGVVSKKSIEAL